MPFGVTGLKLQISWHILLKGHMAHRTFVDAPPHYALRLHEHRKNGTAKKKKEPRADAARDDERSAQEYARKWAELDARVFQL